MPEMVTSYRELISGINSQREALGVRLVDFDDLAGFPSGLSGKVFGPSQVKRLGCQKLFDAIRAAGLALRIEQDPEQLERMKRRIASNFNPRQANQARPNNQSNLDGKTVELVLTFLTRPKKGGIARLKQAVQEYRSNAARLGAITTNQKRQREKAAKPAGVPMLVVAPQAPVSLAHLRAIQGKKKGRYDGIRKYG